MLNFALVGCGRIARKHAELLHGDQLDGAQLAAVCDVKPDRVDSYAGKYGVAGFTDMHEMMAKMGDQIDIVAVLSESGLHAEHCKALAPYGKHLLVEKPMALTLEDADDVIRICDENRVRLFVVKQNRYNLPVVKLREALDAKRFGRIVMGTVRVRWSRDQAYYDQDPWRGTWSMDGGVFANQASHHVDLLEWMLGEPVSVFAKSRTALVDIETEDTGVAVITFSSGAIGIVEATTATRPRDLEGSLSILGERGTVEIGGFAVNEMRIWRFADAAESEEEEILGRYRENPPNVYGYGHLAYLRHVIEAIEQNSPALVDGLEGRKSLELINAIYESIETGEEVSLRFRSKHGRLGRSRDA